MSFSLRLALRGDLKRATEADIKAGRRAVTSVVRRKTNQVKKNIRKEIAGSGLGRKLPKTIQGIAQPKRGASFDAGGVVFSKAIVKGLRPELTDLITVFTEGARIRPRNGRYLAVPARKPGKAPSDPRRPAQPQDFPRGTFVFLRNPPRLAFKKDPTQVMFWLVTQIRIRPRIDPAARFDRAMANFDDLVARKWERDSQRAFDRLG